MTPSESQSPPNLPPKKTSAYSRSATFRLGVWALAGAGALILWHGFWDQLEDRSVTLVTEDGIVTEHRSSGSNHIQGEHQVKTHLQIQKPGGAVSEFTESESYPTPKSGWLNQPIRVRRDAFGHLYEIIVAGETVRDVETTWKYQRIDRWKQRRMILFLMIAGMPLTIIGYLLSFRRQPSVTPPLSY
jgi:hypothetical protein